jgi:NOL1/NOP2/fmu family ribosome biogenesis protein
VIAVPENLASELSILESALHIIAAGCAVGSLKGKVLVPDADLALSIAFDTSAFPEAHVDRDTALAYLHRDAIILPDAPKGYVTIVYEGLPLGFVKNLGNRCNNLHPQSRRIRMDINR